jgi:hypothetical protein
MSTPTPQAQPVSASSRTTGSSTAIVDSNVPPQTTKAMLAKHGKYVLAGLVGSYRSEVVSEIQKVLEGKAGWMR